MLQVAFIKKNKEFVKERLSVKNFGELDLVDKIADLDDERKKLQFEVDETQASLNNAAKEIGKLLAAGNKILAEEKKLEVATLKTSLSNANSTLQETEKKLNEYLVQLPN